MIETNSVVAIYDTHTQADEAVKELLLAHGTRDEVAKARDILHTTHAAEVAVHAAEHGQLAVV
jgi:hypothetical protein